MFDEQDLQQLNSILSQVLALAQDGKLTLENIDQYQLQELVELFD